MNLHSFSGRRLALTTVLLLFLLGALAFAQEPRTYSRADFVNVEGSTLAEKIDRAVREFKGTRAGDSVWLAYHYPARTGISTGPFSGLIYRDDDGVRLERRDDPQSAAVFLLAETGGPRPVFTRVKTLNLSEPYLFENRPVYWLGNVSVDESLAQIEQVMRANAEDKTIVRGALRAIGSHNSPRAVPLLKEAAQKETTADVQRAAIQNLSRIGTKESLDALDELFNAASTPAFKREIVRSYSYAGERTNEKRVLDRLTAIAKSEAEASVRAEAVRRIASFRGEAVEDRLFELYDRADRQLKLEILGRLTPSGAKNDRVASRLVAIAKNDTDVELQRAAVRRLGANRETEQIDSLIDLYESVAVDAVKEEIIARLARSEQKRASEKLLSIAKNDANPKMRQAAIRRLGQNRQAVSFN